jgi:CheY-like chemotaxis protein
LSTWSRPSRCLPFRRTPLPKILVVEDQEAVRMVACGFLEDFGYDVVEAGGRI